MDSGDGVTHVVPIINGYVVGTAIKSIPLAGSTITKAVERSLRERAVPLPSDNCSLLCRYVTSIHCLVALGCISFTMSSNSHKLGSLHASTLAGI